MATMPEPDPYLLEWVEDLGLDPGRIPESSQIVTDYDHRGRPVTVTAEYVEGDPDHRRRVTVPWKPRPDRRPSQPDHTVQVVRHALHDALVDGDLSETYARSWQPRPLEHSDVDDRRLDSRVIWHVCTICGRARGSWAPDPTDQDWPPDPDAEP